jgi:hypothetical protein
LESRPRVVLGSCSHVGGALAALVLFPASDRRPPRVRRPDAAAATLHRPPGAVPGRRVDRVRGPETAASGRPGSRPVRVVARLGHVWWEQVAPLRQSGSGSPTSSGGPGTPLCHAVRGLLELIGDVVDADSEAAAAVRSEIDSLNGEVDGVGRALADRNRPMRGRRVRNAAYSIGGSSPRANRQDEVSAVPTHR